MAELASLNEEDQQLLSEKPPGSLSIQLKPEKSKFNLKIESPLMRGNIFQKYKEKKDSPLFAAKATDHGDRKYRKIAEAENVEEDSDTDLEDEKAKQGEELEPQNKEELMKMLGISQPAGSVQSKGGNKKADEAVYSGSEEGEVVSDEEENGEHKCAKENDPTATTSKPNKPSAAGVAGNLSSDGEVSTDGELSDDSVDEFGRMKKFRSQRVSDDDRKYKYSSGSESSDDEDENRRWKPSETSQ